MDVTYSEINKFLGFFSPECYDDAVKFLNSNMIICIQVDIRRMGDHCGSYITVAEARPGVYNMHTAITTLFALNSKSKSTYLEADEVAFVVSFISRYFKNFKLIFSSLFSYAFVATTNNMLAVITDGNNFPFRRLLSVSLFYQNSFLLTLNFLNDNAEVSDDMWKIITDSRNNINHMCSAYISNEYKLSDKIRKRIHDTYESLPDSDKLLLELGESLDDEEGH